MKFEIDGKSLLKALNYISGSVSSIDNRPTYRKFALAGENNNIVFSTPAGDYTAAVTLPAKFDKKDDETAILPFEELLDFTKQFQSNTFTFTVQKGQCDISLSGSSHVASLQSMGDIRLFGKLPKVGNPDVKLPAQFIQAMAFVFPARCKDAARPDIRGVDVGYNRIIASDGRICLRQTVSLDEFPNTALTEESFSELNRLLTIDETAECLVKVKDSNALFQIGPCQFFTKLRPRTAVSNLDKAVTEIKKRNKNEWTVSKSDLLETFPVVRLATFPEDRRARFKLYKNKTVIQAQTREGSVGTAEVKSVWDGDTGLEIVLNIDYLEILVKDFGKSKKEKADKKETDLIHFLIASKEELEREFKDKEGSQKNPAKYPLILEEDGKTGIIQPSMLRLAAKEKVEDAVKAEA